MSAERIPHDSPPLLARPLAQAARLVTRYPLQFLLASVAIAVLAVAWTAARLEFRTSRLDLLNPQSQYNQLWLEYIEEFGKDDDAVICVEGDDRQTVVAALEDVSSELLRNDHLFHAVMHEVDLSRVQAKGLYYLQPDELGEMEAFLADVVPVVQGDWSRLNLGTMTNQFAEVLSVDPRLTQGATDLARSRAVTELRLQRLTSGLLSSLSGSQDYHSPWPAMPDGVATLSNLGTEYLLANEGRMGFVLLQLASDAEDDFAHNSVAIDALRQLIARTEVQHPQVDVGLTGLPVMENDEMRTTKSSMTKASVVSLVGVAAIFISAFGGVRHPLMTVFALLIALGWSMGYLTLAVGHLNILSVAFGVILIGMGIDFGIHFTMRYLQVWQECRTSVDAAAMTAHSVGPGIVTGAVTSAIAFFAAGWTDFTGIAELGLIAGGGVLLCAAAALIVIPALLQLSDGRRGIVVLPRPLEVDRWMAPLTIAPRTTLIVSLFATTALALGTRHLWYDHNLLNLQPVGLESVELEKRLLEESDQSVWYAVSHAASRDELLQLKDRYLELGSVERVEEIASLVPTDRDAKQPIVHRIRTTLADLPERPPLIPVDPPERLGRSLARVQALLPDGPRRRLITDQITRLRDILRRMPPAECYERISDFQQQMAGDLLTRLHLIRSMADPSPPQLADLPPSLVNRFVGREGRHLLKIYARANIWDMDALSTFVADVRGVDPRATGNPLQTYEASRQMKTSYEWAAIYSLVAILAVLMFDLRNFRDVALALLPLGLGAVQTFGLLGWLGVPLNPANMIVLPLILGIGIDDGVHVVHDFLRQNGRYRISSSTATSVMITSLTTIVGFGSLMMATHRGQQSLGRVLVIGVTCCMVSSLVVLPAALTWINRSRRAGQEPTPPSEIENHADSTVPAATRYRRDPPHEELRDSRPLREAEAACQVPRPRVRP